MSMLNERRPLVLNFLHFRIKLLVLRQATAKLDSEVQHELLTLVVSYILDNDKLPFIRIIHNG